MSMKKVCLLLLATLLITVIVCCDENDNPAQTLELKNFSNTGCKNSTRAGDDDIKEFVEYAVLHEGYLYVNHQNIWFNCCPGELKAEVSVENHCITVSEWSTEEMCNCMCPFDMSYEVGPLKEGVTYTIKIGYKGVEKEVADFVFQNTMSGVWGII